MIEEYQDIPMLMRNAKRWLLWKSVPNKDETKKSRKLPFYADGTPRRGQLDSKGDLNRMVSLDIACQMLYAGDYSGIGFALGADGTGNYWQGLDFDKVSQHPELGYLIDDLPGYTEMSPSGDGWHSIGYGRRFESLGSNESGIEAYSSGRYFTVTGECAGLSEPCCIADFVEQTVKQHHSRHKKDKVEVKQETITVSDRVIADIRSALLFLRADDRELWQKNGHRLKGLGDVGRGLWLEWSSSSDKYDPQADAKTWESFKPTHTGYPAIFKEAASAGWLNPAKKQEQFPSDIEEDAWITAGELSDNAKAPNYLIDSIIETNTHGLLAGGSQSYKSFCALKMAHSICTGKDFFGHEVYHKGKVLYICGEGLGALGRRIKALEIEDGELGDGLIVKKRPLSIDHMGDMEWLRLQINEIKPVMVIFDTFSSLASNTTENANDEVAKTLKMISGCCMDAGSSSLVVHHYGKVAENGSRGASAFSANVDFELSMTRKPGDMITTLSCKKTKDGDYFKPLILRAKEIDLRLVRQNGKSTTSLVLELDGMNERQKACYQIIVDLITYSGIESVNKLGVNETQIKEAFNKKFREEGSSNPSKISKDNLDFLLKNGKILEKDSFFWLA
jgi:hypothetical protein